MSWEAVQNTGKAFWHVIKDGDPSAEVRDSRANAVPQVADWQDLGTGFYSPKSVAMTYQWPVNIPDWFGKYLYVDAKVVLKWDYGATYKGGGAFIPDVWVEAPVAYAGWSWDLNVDVHFHPPTNANPGDRSRPIARIPCSVILTVETYEHSDRVEWGYTIYGNGAWSRDS